MTTRTIMIFPKFHNMEIINFYRKKYDPLSGLVNPHITLVFPFQSDMGNDALDRHISNELMYIKPFEISLYGVSKHSDEFGNYLFLNVTEGEETIRLIHEKLYSHVLKKYNKGYPYFPHLTLGNVASTEELERAYLNASKCREIFKATINTISTEMIGRSGKSIIISEHQLGE